MPLLVAPAMAQEASTEAPSDAIDGEIIVTAQRRNERLEEVPMSVSVASRETLEASGVTSLRDIQNITSGVQIGAGGAFPQPAIRGVSTILSGTFENNVAVYVDGVYQPAAQTINIDLPNVESVQVLKGPQGTLYGRNATGGAILLSTITPSNHWHGKAELTYAMYDDKRASGYIAGPISDAVGVSVAGYIRRGDGYNRIASRTTLGASSCCATPIEQDSLRFKVRVRLTDDFNATLAYNFTRISDSRSNIYTPVENVNPGGNFLYGVAPAGATLPKTVGVIAADFGNIMASKQHEGSATLEWETGIGKLRSITAYADLTTDNSFDFDGSYIPIFYFVSQQRQRTFQQSIDFAINAIDRVDLILGGTYYWDKLGFDIPIQTFSALPATIFGINTGSTGAALANALSNSGATQTPLSTYDLLSIGQFDQRKEAWALFADLTFKATDHLSINVGGRYSEETQRVSGSTTTTFNPLLGLGRAFTTTGATFRKFTPRASIRYEISPRTNVYFSYSQGFRSGAFNAQLPACVNTLGPSCWVPADQETIDAFEIGLKKGGRGFRFELAGFYYNYKNLQISATRQLSTGAPIVDVVNAPKASIYGIDASFEWEPIENLTVRGSAAWLHARYGAGVVLSGTGVCFSGPSGCGVGLSTGSDPLTTYLNQTQNQDLSGLQMSRAPNFSASFGADYFIPKGDGGLRFSANVKYTSSYVVTNPSIWCQPLASNNNCAGIPADRQRDQRFRAKAFALVNASITWTDPEDRFLVRIWGNNLTDHRYPLQYTGGSTGTYIPQAEPRTVGGTVGFKFGRR